MDWSHRNEQAAVSRRALIASTIKDAYSTEDIAGLIEDPLAWGRRHGSDEDEREREREGSYAHEVLVRAQWRDAEQRSFGRKLLPTMRPLRLRQRGRCAGRRPGHRRVGSTRAGPDEPGEHEPASSEVAS